MNHITNMHKYIKITLISLGILGIIFAIPYFINCIASVNNKYIYPVLMKIETGLNDDCSSQCRFICIICGRY